MSPRPADNTTMEVLSSLDLLRAAWQPLNDEHRTGRRYSDGVHLRIYRCLSWADKAAAAMSDADSGDVDLAFILNAIAFNALWGQEYRPGEDRPSQLHEWKSFLLDLAEAENWARSWT